jgi:RNA polymerase sigma factor (sigma-70 family)
MSAGLRHSRNPGLLRVGATVSGRGGVIGGVDPTMDPAMVEPAVVAEDFEGFYGRAWRGAARLATALTGDTATGEEIAQDAFVLLGPRFGKLTNPDGYLRVTVVNLARSSMRARGRRSLRERRAASPESATMRQVDSDLLVSLDRLSYEQRAVLVLRYWADWDELAIADALGCQPSTVRSHARRALVLLRKEIER